MSSGYRATHQPALELELSIVDALLQRNRCSQERTRYYQRLRVAARAWRRWGLREWWIETSSLVQHTKEQNKRQQKKRQRQAVFWQVKLEDPSPSSQDHYETTTALRERLTRLCATLMDGVPEIVSRIDYAADAFFVELARGFFLPFCTVAVAALARIRTLSLLLAGTVSEQVPKLQADWQTLSGNASDTIYEATALRSTLDWLHRQTSEPQRKPTDGVQKTLEELGLAKSAKDNNPQEVMDGLNGSVNEVESVKEAAKDTASGTTPSTTRDDVGDDETDQHDVGEAMAFQIGPSSVYVAAEDAPAKPTKSSMSNVHELDRNMAMVEEFKAAKAKKKSKKPNSASQDKSVNKKKRIKAKKGDFFDELFG